MTMTQEISGSRVNIETVQDAQGFPEVLRKQLLDKLEEWEDFWCHADVQTVKGHDAWYLEVRLELTQRQLFIRLADDGTGFELIAPVYTDFPKEASHFVLADLSYSNATWRFFLVEDTSEKNEQARVKPEVLCARAPMDLEAFLNSHGFFLPNLIAKLDEAEECVKAHIAGKPVSRYRVVE